MNAIRSGILTGHTATFDNNSLIVENIMMYDVRNDSVYICVTVPAQGIVTIADIIDESDPTILYVTGEYARYIINRHMTKVSREETFVVLLLTYGLPNKKQSSYYA